MCTEYKRQTQKEFDGCNTVVAKTMCAPWRGMDEYAYRSQYSLKASYWGAPMPPVEYYNSRDDPILCAIVEQLGEKSKIVSSRPHIEYYDSDQHPNYKITDYDGVESVEPGTDDGQTQKLREVIHEQGSELEILLADLTIEGPLEDMSKEKLVAQLSELARKTGAFTQKLRSIVPPPVKIIMKQKKRVLLELPGSPLQPSYKEVLKRWPGKE